MNIKKTFAFLILSCFILPQLAFAGAWTLPRNNIWLEYYMKGQWAKHDFGSNKDLHRKNNDARSWGWSMIPKFEYGVTDWFTVLGSIEYKEAKYKEYARNPAWGPYSVKNHGFTNVDLGGRVRFLEKPVVLSGQIKASCYTGYDEGKEGVARQPELGDRNDALDLRLLVGKKFDTAIPFYFGAETGYRFKNRDVCNDIPFFVEGGFWPCDWLLIKSEIDGYWAHDITGKLEKEYAIWRIGPVFQLFGGDDITRAGKSFDIGVQYGWTFWGRNTSADQELILKVSSQF